MIIGEPWRAAGYLDLAWKQVWHKCYALLPTRMEYGEWIWLQIYWRRKVWSPSSQSYYWERLDEKDYKSIKHNGVGPWMPEKFRR
jgi:hypothetical protein